MHVICTIPIISREIIRYRLVPFFHIGLNSYKRKDCRSKVAATTIEGNVLKFSRSIKVVISKLIGVTIVAGPYK